MHIKQYSPCFGIRKRSSRGFTMVELLVSVGIIGMLSGIVITAIGPKKIILSARDSERTHIAEQIAKARMQKGIDNPFWIDNVEIPEGAKNAIPICEEGMDRDSSCVNLDYLVEENYIGRLKRDATEPCGYLGYKIYKTGGQIVVYATHLGKLSGDSGIENGCITDTIAPLFSNIQIDLYADTATITWDTDEESNTQVEFGLTTQYGSKTSLYDIEPLVTSHSVVLSGLQGYTTYHFRATSRDAAGNLGKSTDYTFLTDDTTPPTVTTVSASAITDSTATITWITDEASRSQVEYWIGAQPHEYYPDSPDQSLVTEHSVQLSEMLPDTEYTFIVGSRDAKGNLGISGEYTFRTLPDVTPPSISAITTSDITSDAVTISWTTNEFATRQIEYGTTTSYGSQTTLSGSLSKTHSQRITGLSTDTLYYFRVKSKDASDNEGVSSDQTVTITDTTNPVISGIAVSNNTGTQATLTWTTNENADTQLAYGLTAGYGYLSTLNSTASTSHSTTITNLQPKTLYHVQALSRDPAGNLGSSADYTFTTASLDPTFSSISVSNTTTTATISWTTNKPADRQIYYGNSPSPASGTALSGSLSTSHTMRFNGLVPNTTYYYILRSKDAQNNQGESVESTFTTNAAYEPGIVAYWKLDETSGTTATDLSGNGQAATIVNGAAVSSTVAPLTFSNVRSRLFDGTNDYIRSPDLRTFFTNEHVTVSLWIYPTAAGVIMSEQNCATPTCTWHNSQLEILSSGQVRAGVWGGSVLAGSVSFNSWNHIALRYNDSTNTLQGFVNGVAGGSAVFDRSSPWESAYHNLYYIFGVTDSANLGDGTYFNGNIDDIRVYTTALSNGDITTLSSRTGGTDTTAPTVLTGPSAGSITQTTATITWTTDEASNTEVYIGTTPAPTSGPAAVATLLTNHSYALTSLTPNTTYYYRIRSRDGAGNQYGATVDATFTTLADTTPPVITAGPTCTATSGTSLLVAWNTDENSDTQVWYSTSTNPTSGTTVNPTMTTTHTQAIGGLLTDTTYYYRVRSKDAYGNQYTSPTDLNCATDGTAPIITSGPTISDITPNGATISWTTNENSNTVTQVGTSPGVYTSTYTVSNSVMSHTDFLDQLSPSTTYYYRVRSSDGAGNMVTSSEFSFVTPATDASVIMHWQLNEVSGTTASDSSGNGRTGTLVNGPVWTTGKAGNGVQTDGTNDVINGSNPNAVRLANGTLSAWVKTANAGSGLRAVVTKQNAYGIYLSDNVVVFYDWNTSTSRSSGINIADNQWHHVALVFRSGVANTSVLYVDGVARTTSTMTVVNQASSLTAGAANTTGSLQQMAGTIDEMRIYNRMLNSSEILAIMSGTDTTAPVVTAGPTANVPTNTTATITWTTDEISDTQVWYSTSPNPTSGTAVASALITSHSQGLTGLTPNVRYYYRVRSKDASGNQYTSPADLTFWTDLTAPTLTGGPTVVSSDGTTATVTWSTNESSDTKVEYGLTTAYGTNALTSDSVLSHSQALTGLSPNTQYNYRVLSRDAAGNLYTSGNYTFTTTDSVAPILSSRTVSILSDTSARIDWTTNETSSTQIEYGLTSGLGQTTTLDSSLVISHTQTISGLSPNQTYYFRVKSRDAAGNTATSGIESFLTTDNGQPVISNVSVHTITETRATITWTTNEAADTKVEYGTTPALGQVASTNDSVTSHSQLVSGLTSNTTYYYRVVSKDAANNIAESIQSTFTTLLDGTAPVISNISLTNVTENSAMISWTTNEPADRQVEYGTTTSYGSQTTLSGSLSTSHSVTITGLNVNTLYHFRVRSRDSFANLAISANNTVTTVDTGAPIISNVDAAATTETTATVTWTTNEPANRQVEYGTTDSLGSYSSIQTNLLTSHSVGLNALTPNTKYFYRVRSRDAAGNLTVSSIQTFITDVIPPTITVGPALSDLSGNSVTVSWATDEAADSQVLYGLTSGALTEETTLDATLVTSHTQSLTGLIENQIYFYQVQTRDEAGNITVSAEGTFSTDVTAPIVSSVIATPASTSATLQWTTNEQATSEFVYGLTTSYGTSGGTTILVTSHNQTIMSLTPGTTYYYEIRSKDAAGNTGVQAGTFTTGS